VSKRGQRVIDAAGEARQRESVQVEGGRGGSLVVQDGHPHNPLAGVGDVRRLQVRRQLPLPFIPPVLKPDFDLRLRQVERHRQARSLRAAQVPLQVEGGLQLEDLAAAEHRPGLLLPGGGRRVAAGVRVLVVVRQVAVGGLPVGFVAALR